MLSHDAIDQLLCVRAWKFKGHNTLINPFSLQLELLLLVICPLVKIDYLWKEQYLVGRGEKQTYRRTDLCQISRTKSYYFWDLIYSLRFILSYRDLLHKFAL